jgi:hypothetical protein
MGSRVCLPTVVCLGLRLGGPAHALRLMLTLRREDSRSWEAFAEASSQSTRLVRRGLPGGGQCWRILSRRIACPFRSCLELLGTWIEGRKLPLGKRAMQTLALG